jgi:hypothetical protein
MSADQTTEPAAPQGVKITKATGVSIGILLCVVAGIVIAIDRFGRIESHTAVIEERFKSLETSVVAGLKEVKHTLEKQGEYWNQSALAVARMQVQLDALAKRVEVLESAK